MTAEPVEEQTTEPTEEQTTEPTEEQITEPEEELTAEPADEQITEPIEEQTTEPEEELTAEPVEEQTTEPEEELTAEPADEQITEPIEEQTTEPEEELTAEPAEEQTTEPEEELTAEPAGEQTTEPTEEQTTEPTEEQTTEPADEQTTEPAEEQTTEPTDEQTTEPTEEQTTEPAEEQTTEPADEQTTEPAEEQITEPAEEQTTEPAEEQTTEPAEEQTTEPADEQTTEPTDEQTTEPAEEQITEPTEEQITEPTEEQTTEPAEEQTTEPTEEQTTEPTDEQPTEPARPAQTFAGGTARVRVRVDAPEGAFPAGTTMEVVPNEDSGVLSGIAEAVSEDFVEVRDICAVDIAFHSAGGEEIEPLLPTAVVMSVDAITESQRALIVHVNDAGVAEIVEQTGAPQTHDGALSLNMELPGAAQSDGQQPVEEQPVAEQSAVAQPEAAQYAGARYDEASNDEAPDDEAQYGQTPDDELPDEIIPAQVDDVVRETETDLSFEADAFSTYAVVIIEDVAARRMDASGDTWAVEMRYGADAGIPADAALEVSEMTGAVAEVFTEQAARVLDVDVESFTYVKVLDMAIVKDGEKLQPQTPVGMSVQLHDFPESMAAEDELCVVHFSAIPEALDCAVEGNTVTFEADGFSAYVIAIRSERQYPAQTFTERAAGVTVSVNAPEGAFPAGTTMRVRRVMNRDTISDIREAVAEDFVEVKRVQLVDIAFYDADGLEIEPLMPVSVAMTVTGMTTEQEAVVVHVDDAGAVNVQSSEVQDPLSGSMEVTFDAGAFSMYAVVVTETISTHYIDASGRTYNVEVSYGPEAGIPSGAKLAVSELTGDEAEAYAARAAEALNVNGSQVAYAKALDISILADGAPVQPQTPVSVSIRLLDAPDLSALDNVNVVHLGRKAEVIDCEVRQESVGFEADGFSVYVVLCTTHEQKLTASDGNEYLVTVTYDNTSGIPENAELYVSEIKEGDAGYDEYVAQSASVLGQKPENLAFARPFDITLKNPETGEEYQPNEAVQVSIQLLKDNLDNYANVDVVHIPGGDGEEAQVMDTTVHGEAVEFETDGFSVYVLIASNSTGSGAEADSGYTCALTIGESTSLSAILSGLSIEADGVKSVAAEGNNLTVNQTAGEQPTDWTVVLNSAKVGVLQLTMSDDSTVDITVKPLVTVTANDAAKTYGDSDPEFTATVVGLEGEDTVAYDVSRESGENAGAYTITPSGEETQGKYVVKYVTGTFTINTKALTITAASAEKKFDNIPLTEGNFTHTDLALEDRIESVNMSEASAQTHMGTCENVPVTVIIKNASNEDVTTNYDITYVNGTLTVTWPENMVTKELTAFNGNLATYQITVNSEGYPLTDDGQTYILRDTFSENQSINYGSVTVSDERVTYDFSENTGTYIIPDGTRVAITYTTRVKGQVGDEVSFSNTAVVGNMEGTEFKAGPSTTVQETKKISPTGTDISGIGGVYSIDLFAYADGHMERGLEGAEFRLLDSNMRPLHYLVGENSGKEITFTTDEHGTVAIVLNSENDGLSIQKNTVYFLEMVTAPYEIVDGDYVYYQKDDTFYSFLITDEPSYKYGDIYSYFNGDVLKVRCYPEAKGINVTKRFSGNYTLTDEQKNAIRFVLQKEAQYTASGWVDVESHTYEDFSYGSINFSTGREGGTELEDFSTYRIIEENALPEALADTIDENVSVTVSYQQDGKRVTENSNEFTVNPDEKLAFSYDFAFTNEYVDHKLTLIKINENTGAPLPGAIFSIYAADNTETPVATCTTGADGSITIRRSDEGAGYAPDTLYYVVESKAPDGYVIPASPEKVYFYFSENGGGVPTGLPAGRTATDLTTSYNTVTLPNSSEKVSVPVTVVWGINSNEAWPDKVSRVVVGLYKSVGGAAAEKVLDNNSEALTLELTKEKYYDTTTFVNLPAQEDGKNIVYSVEEEGIYAPDGTNITNQFADSVSVSGTDWYVVKNEPAISVVVQKQWFEQDGTTQVSDTSARADVTFDLYRTTTQAEGNAFNRAELVAFLANAEKVRTGLTLSKDSWSTTIDSLQSTDREGRPYYYYALENPIPDNQEDSYLVVPATASAPRTLTIKNKQTPFTVTIAVNDIEKTYGDETPDYTFTADVKEEGATVEISGPDEKGEYTATVTSGTGATSDITFTVSREEGEDAGAYAITPSGDALQGGYRVLYESGTLTINKAPVTITAGAEKVYGENDPALVTVVGMKKDEDPTPGVVLNYTVSREEGEDVGEYPITLTGETDQKNYTVTYVRKDPEGKAYTFKITRATATVTADGKGKTYGEDDPEFTASVTGLKFSDEPTVLNYDLTRAPGEDVGTYTITPAGDAVKGNYNVEYVTGTLTIGTADLTIKVENDEKTYGDVDPEWEVTFEGLTEGDEGGTLTSVLNPETGARDYTYTVGEGESAVELLKFSVSRAPGENVNVDGYDLTPSGAQTQGNYKITYTPGKLMILRAELLVTPDRKVKAVGIVDDPLLTATVTGWMNGDQAAVHTSVEQEGKVIAWTYTRDGETLLTFSLKRDEGEEEGEYPIRKVAGEAEQSNYTVEYEEGVFEILAILDIDVTQPLVDHVDVDANPTYTYKATLDLAGTGMTEYTENGFEMVEGVPTQIFSLPAGDKSNMKTLKVPGGAKLTVQQTDEHVYADYTTAVRLDSAPYVDPEDSQRCVLDTVDTYHEIAFAHNRISLPVSARAAVGQTEEGAVPLEGREGAMGIPEGEEKIRAIDSGFADDMHSKIEYVLPTDKYYAYDHASLYTREGTAISGGTDITQIKYDQANARWQYKTRTSEDFVNVPDDSQMVLFYMPKYVCKIGTEKFYSLREAVSYADGHGKTATIEMLIGEYSIRSKDDAVTIPADCTITITTAETEYEGTGTAVISRSLSYPSGHLFYNDGTLTFDTITLDGKSVQAGDALVLNQAENAELTVNKNATLQNAKGVNGGAIYVKTGTVTVNGTLTNNAATLGGGAVYVKTGTFTMGADGKLTGNSATTGGAVYVYDDGTIVNIGGTIGGAEAGEGNTATSGGAVYINKGTVSVTGSVTGNTAENGGAVYQVGGTLTVDGRMTQNTASVNGGAVYQVGGSLTVNAGGSLSGNSATGNGGAVYQAGGTLSNAGTISGNNATNGGGIYRVNGTLTVGGTLSGNTATESGGGFYTAGGAVTVTGTLGGTAEGAGNSAANGGAIYTSGTTLSLNGASFTRNSATTNGGAIYALNANTVIGGTWSNNAASEGTAMSFKGNEAKQGNGGALYMEGGTASVMNANSTLQANKAANGGAIYATSGAITVEKGMLQGNEANANGGAIYVDSASVTVKGGTLGGTGKGNEAKQGNGGAIYSGSGPVTISGGTLAGNSAESGLGGAIYAGSSTVNYTSGNINGGNIAVNGAAIYVGSGIANVSASITGNTATNGGAIGVGGISARLYFKGNAEVNSNTMNGAQSNVYLDVDSELVVNADSLSNSKKIGIYVPGDVNSDQVVKHGDVTGYFGAYVSAGTLANISTVFKSDRFSDLKVAYENNRVYWISNLTYDIYWLKNYDSQFPPTTSYTAAPSKKVCTNKTYAPRERTSDIYDLVMAMKLYEKHNNDFVTNVGANYASTAVYAYTFSDRALNNTFANYLKTIRWDGTARKWMYDKQDGTTAPVNTAKLIIFYSAPAYLTVVNNNTSGLELDISELTVLGKDAGEGVYGYVTAKNGATVTTLRTLTADDLKLGAGDSIKLMFPGAQGQKFTLKGTFTGEGAGEGTAVSYTFNGGASQTITGTTVDFSSDSFKLNTDDEAAELIFGDALPICKIGNEPFSTLKAAMAYAVAQKTSTGNNTYKIEMLVDYLVPKDDILEIPAGYDITFTTAAKDAETLPYKGNGTRATLSRDTGNAGSSVSATNSTLTVDNLAFDGRSLTAGGKGGAVSTSNCTTVTITNCDFKGYRADNGGAVYVDNTKAGSSLTVEDCSFYNCQTNASVDKAGGGGIWTTARELYVRRCTFDFCACLSGKAQAGSIFHNIQAGWFANSKMEVSDCSFSNSYAVGGSGGTVESDAYDVTIQRCSFVGSYTNKSGGSGGAVNTYANNEANTTKYCIMRVIDCSFDNCSAKNGAAMGGAVRCSTHDLILRGCIFRNTQGVTGGAVAMTNSNAKRVEIYGCTFENCIATGNGGAVSAPVGTLIVGVEDTELEDYQDTYLNADETPKNGKNNFTDCAANRGGGIDNPTNDAIVTMENVDFTRCAARTGNGGALYTQAKELSITVSITGDANTFTDCTGNGSGGAVFQNRNVDGSFVKLVNCTFTGCEANNNGNGGGLYATARMLTINYDTANDSAIERAKGSFVNCTAANAGGGLYHDYAGTVNIANCGFDGCTAKTTTGGGLYTSAHTLKIIGVGSKFKNCTAQTDGGGLYHNRDANGSTLTFKDGSFESCTATGNYGGAIYTKVKGTVTLEGCTVKDSTAKSQGGGIYFLNGNTASFDGCTITGNTVINSDSKGGGVYVAGGTTTYKSGTVSGCSAAYGGGWYQNNGNLYILGGSISGSATVNGGGLYINDSKAWVRQYSGTVAGTATGNGGGIYENAGNYTIGDATYEGTAYSGASVGTVTVDEGGSPVYTATAVNGGSIYQNTGTIYQNAGSRIVGQASANGGGVYVGGALQFNGGLITNCMASANGGGVYFASTTNDFNFYADADSKIQNCRAANGGGVYMNSAKIFHIGQKDQSSIGTIENCHATANGGGLYQTSGTCNLQNASIIRDCTAAANGGGVYQAGGTFNIYGTSRIEHCEAEDNGGGLYNAGGILTFEGGSIIRNVAEENGGGVYHAGGTFNMTSKGAVIGGSTENANTANVGAGVFVAEGQAASFNDNNYKTLAISYNHALTAGGGIAVGGPEAVLTFQGTATVRYNTMGSNNAACNVYLDQNRNTVIQNNALNADGYIGVYASDEQDAGHGQSGMPFATYANEPNLNVYHNDRRPYLYGVKGSNNLVIWPEFVCKITDGEGKLLYKDADGTPAVYAEVENRANSAYYSAGAFYVLNQTGTPALYQKDDEGNYTLYNQDGKGEYQVQMLVENYEIGSTRQIKLDAAVARKVTLTRASDEEDECGFYYTGDPRFPATITRTADTSCMVFVGGSNSNGWELTLRNITLDGGNKAASETGAILRVVGTGKATLDSDATLQNGLTNNAGGAVYIDNTGSLTMNAGSQIKDCSAGTSNGGAVAINNGTFTMNAGSSITGCSAANGGGVYLDNSANFNMRGGEIRSNSATGTGGGITHNKDKEVKIYFSGYCTVTDNTLNGGRCNVQLTKDSHAIINANGLDARSEIGVYTANGTIYDKHGGENDDFGTWHQEDDKLFCFVNDRHTNYRGFQSIEITDEKIYWEYHPLLTVTKEVNSDLAYDQNTAEFSFTVTLKTQEGESVSLSQAQRNSIKGMEFNGQGIAEFTLKKGESKTGEFPITFDKYRYEVKEDLSDDDQADYTTAADKNGEAYAFIEDKPLTVSGQLGENIGTENPSSLSEVVFTNTRATGDLTVSKQVVSDVESDRAQSFDFKVTLNDEGISKTFETTKRDADNNETVGTLNFTAGVSDAFGLKDGESLTIKGLPTDLEYSVGEILTDAQRAQIRTQVFKDGTESKPEGRIGEKSAIETVEGVEKTVYASEVAFTNNFLEIVCKITNRSRALLYYRDAASNLQPAIFAHLEDAFDQINSGNLRTSGNGTVSGQLRIEMVVPEYTMEKTATLNSGKTVLLSTALTSDDDYPYNKGESDGADNVATVYRGFEEGSMIVDSGALTIDKIVLDGGSSLLEQVTTTASNGGIVNVAGAVRLTVNSAAKLQNSVTSGQGGAIWLNTGASLAMNGTISNCSAASGGGVYASNGFTSITTIGTITGCNATSGNGGAIYASTGTSVNLNAGTALTGNAATENGGAVYTKANLILRGSVGGTGASEGNTADGNGGGIYMGENTTFTMYAGSSISGNQANNGGGLATVSTARIAGGTLQSNRATQSGGAIYAAERATVTISGAPVITGNEAALGGAVYDGGTVTMTGGAMTGNTATEKGGAVYVASEKTFTMSGGSIKDGNKSPEGAVSTDANATLAFSGNAVVSGNVDTDATTIKNVYLGFDSNEIITSSGLGSSANIGIYVADGEPEDESVENHVDNPIYADHGVGGRDFGTYTGGNLSGARLNKFVNDRDTLLTGMSGTLSGETRHIAWIGKGLELKVTQYRIQTDGDGNPVLSGTQVPVQNASFTFTRVIEGSAETQVWSGKSGTDGIVTIPWGGNETAGGNVASFVPGSVYRLDQTAAAGNTVLPAGHWKVTIGRDNSVTWEVEQGDGNVDRTLNIALPENAFLGETFGLKNDVKPTLTYNATGGKLSDNKPERQDTIAFTTKETSHAYTIKEVNPTWDSHVFKAWATMDKKPEVESTEQLTDEQLQQKLIEQGYFEYSREDRITFYRGTDSADPAEKYTQTTSKGDMTLYALWDEVVCKITDRNGTLLYIDGSPAVYGTLEDGFKAYNEAGTYDFTYSSGGRATARRIEMLVGEYELSEGVTLNRGKTVMLTTAPRTDTDGYAYTGEENTVCVITRGEGCTGSMITNNSNLTLMNVTLDGDGHRNDRDEDRVIVCDGGIVNNAQASAVLTIAEGATLRNSFVEGNGGAVNAIAGTTVYLTGGTISGNSSGGTDGTENGNGAGIYLAKGSRLYLSGNPSFSNNVSDATLPDDAKNGAENYTQARQDIYLAGAAEEGEALTSITLTGNLPDNYPAGSIWVWAEGDNNTEPNHYYMLKQFAVVSFTGTISEATCKAFRNARPDADTDCGGDYLTGQTGDNIGTNRCIYWTGGYDFSFLKVDGFGKPLPGATFTLYTSYTNKDVYTLYQKGGEPVTATSSDGENEEKYPDPEDSTKAQAAGTVLFPKIAPKVYYMVETTTPEGYVENTDEATTIYKLTMRSDGTAKLDRKLLSEEDTAYQEVYKVETQTATEATATEPAKDAVYQYRVMNTSTAQRKAILRKVEENTNKPLPGVKFEVLRYDRTQVSSTDINGGTETTFTSGDSGVYFIDMLPFGTYYLHETKNASGAEVDLWFILTVNENGVGYETEDLKVINTLRPETTTPD